MAFSENKKFWIEFIAAYKAQRPIWDVKHPTHKNKLIRKQCYDVLVEKAKEILSYADENYVKCKIESLRASFRREHKKVKAWKKRGRIYEPLLWYYDLLTFVEKNDNELKTIKRRAEGTYIDDEDIEENDADDFTTENLVIEHSSPSLHYSENPSSSVQFEEVICSASEKPPKRMNAKRLRKQSYLNISEGKDDSISDITTITSEKEDRNALFARNLTCQLDEMNPVQRIIAEKLISDVIFHGKLKNLTKTSSILLKSAYQIHSDSS